MAPPTACSSGPSSFVHGWDNAVVLEEEQGQPDARSSSRHSEVKTMSEIDKARMRKEAVDRGRIPTTDVLGVTRRCCPPALSGQFHVHHAQEGQGTGPAKGENIQEPSRKAAVTRPAVDPPRQPDTAGPAGPMEDRPPLPRRVATVAVAHCAASSAVLLCTTPGPPPSRACGTSTSSSAVAGSRRRARTARAQPLEATPRARLGSSPDGERLAIGGWTAAAGATGGVVGRAGSTV